MLNNFDSSYNDQLVFRKHPLICVFIVLLYLVFLTISWDRASIKLVGSTFRLTQFFLIFCFLIWLPVKISSKSFKFQNSGLVESYIILFILWCISTDVTSYNLKRSVLYSVWLVVNFMMVALVVDYVGTSRVRMRQMLRVYFYSFVFISIFSFVILMLEFMGLIHLGGIDPETGKEAARGQLRMFGLTYEPSYFATYLITYLTAVGYLRLWGRKMYKELRCKKWHYYAMLIAFIGSFSRAGIVVFLPIVLIMMIRELLYARKFRDWLVPKWVFKVGFVILIFISICGFVLVSRSEFTKRLDQYFFSGMGVGAHKGSAHSSGTRLIETAWTVQAGLMNPWTGVGMGGFGSFFVENITRMPMRKFWLATIMTDAFKKAQKFHFIQMRAPEAMNVTAEVFATTGVPGLILWLIMNIIIPVRLYRLSRAKSLDRGMQTLLRAFAWGHVALFAILHFNQNFMRPYYWLNIAMCCSIYFVAKSEIAANQLSAVSQTKKV